MDRGDQQDKAPLARRSRSRGKPGGRSHGCADPVLVVGLPAPGPREDLRPESTRIAIELEAGIAGIESAALNRLLDVPNVLPVLRSQRHKTS
jgi:hypothetical protein